MAVNYVQKRFISKALQKFCYNLSGFNKYGLMRDDMRTEHDPDHVEALRRLPKDLRDARNYRVIRAIQLSITHDILPKDQWTKFEDDVMYLKPYLEEVLREKAEQDLWNKKY